MKRDFDLVRKILCAVEEAAPGQIIDGFTLDEFSPQEIGEHLLLMQDAGLIDAEVKRTRAPGRPFLFVVRGLTWKGHDFLDAARDDTIWRLAKERILKPAGSATFDVLLDWLKTEANKRLFTESCGLPLSTEGSA